MTSSSPDHKLAQALDLARREAELTTAALAEALSFNPRTVRRYLNGERRPERDTVVRWEQVCGASPDTLTALYDGSPATVQLPQPLARTGFPLRSGVVVAVLVVLVTLGAVLLLRKGDEPHAGAAAQGHPAGVAYHRFTASYVGDVWIRITPASAHAGEGHRVKLHWGKLRQEVERKDVARSLALFTAKNKPDRTPMQVTVEPAATIAFGEGDVPAGALDINQGWR
jgi:hypothetical protein